MPWLLGIFPIHVGIKPGFPDFPTSSFQPLLPTQPLPVVSSAAAAWWGEEEGEGLRGRRDGKGKREGRMPVLGPIQGKPGLGLSSRVSPMLGENRASKS